MPINQANSGATTLGNFEDYLHKYKAIDFYRILIAEKKGMPLQNYEE